MILILFLSLLQQQIWIGHRHVVAKHHFQRGKRAWQNILKLEWKQKLFYFSHSSVSKCGLATDMLWPKIPSRMAKGLGKIFLNENGKKYLTLFLSLLGQQMWLGHRHGVAKNPFLHGKHGLATCMQWPNKLMWVMVILLAKWLG